MRKTLAKLHGRSVLIRHRVQRAPPANQAALLRALDELDQQIAVLWQDLERFALLVDGRRF